MAFCVSRILTEFFNGRLSGTKNHDLQLNVLLSGSNITDLNSKWTSWAFAVASEFARELYHGLHSGLRDLLDNHLMDSFLASEYTRCVSLHYRKRNPLTLLQRCSFRIKKSSQERQMELFLFGTKHYQIPLPGLLSVKIRD